MRSTRYGAPQHAQDLVKMETSMRRALRSECGITGMEAAVILIAFVVVSSVFAFVVLSAGTFSTESTRKAVYSGVSEVESTLELRGSVLGTSADNVSVSTVVFTVANVAGGEPVDMTAPTVSGGSIASSSGHKVVITYIDSHQVVRDSAWTGAWAGGRDGDEFLEEGELFEITVPLTATASISNPLSTPLGIGTNFRIEVKASRGAALVVEKTTPAHLDRVMTLL
jgi:flagellin FlaB